jgi:predicted dehydrogenase
MPGHRREPFLPTRALVNRTKEVESVAIARGCLIGCGYVSLFHLEGWARQKRGRLVAVCDLDAAKAEAACRHGVCTAYTDAAEMLLRERPDFVEICTRPESHLDLVKLAAGHAVHVLCQKPIAPTLGELDEMIAVCSRAGVRFMVHENFRWRSWYLHLKAALGEGRLGTPFRLGLEMHDQRCLKPDGLADQPYFYPMSRLILYEIGPHAIDLARWLFGEPHRVFATSQRLGRQAGEDVVHLTLWHPEGRMSHLDLSWCTAGHHARPEWGLHHTWVEGDKGTLRTRDDGRLEWTPVGQAAEVWDVPIDPDPMVEGYANTQAHFLECLESGRRFDTDGEDTRRTMNVVFAGYESARTMAPVAL